MTYILEWSAYEAGLLRGIALCPLVLLLDYISDNQPGIGSGFNASRR
jgi:hypothetical protein